MLKVSIREFQRNAPKYMKQLPFVITRYNKPLGIVRKYEDVEVYIKEKHANA